MSGHVRAFLTVLGLTALVWLAMAMSERREYPLYVRVEMSGYDVRRYAAVEADTALTLQVEANGFNMLVLGLRKESVTLNLDMRGETVRRYERHEGEQVRQVRAVAVADLAEEFRRQLSDYNIRQTGSGKDSLLLVLAERSSRVFRPDISKVSVGFAEGYGLYGEPRLSPAEVTLYGSKEALDRIDTLRIAPTTLEGLSATGRHRLFLDPEWKKAGDLYASTEILQLYVPVESYVEREYEVPVTVLGADTNVRIRLYPERVRLSLWVARRDLAAVSPERLAVTADYRDISDGRMKLRLARFPEVARVRSMVPAEVRCVVIK